MKNKDVIKALQQLDPEMEVGIFDHRYNLKQDYGDGSKAGIYKNFEIVDMTEDHIPENSPRWIALSFNNEMIEEHDAHE